MLQRGGVYALKALLEMALEPQLWHSVSELARAGDIPAPMLEQLLLKLRRAGLVEGRRGRQGGYRLRQSPAAIPLTAILSAVTTGPLAWDNPEVEGMPPQASDRVAEALQRRLRRALERELAQLTLEELLFDLRSTRASLSEEGGLMMG